MRKYPERKTIKKNYKQKNSKLEGAVTSQDGGEDGNQDGVVI